MEEEIVTNPLTLQQLEKSVPEIVNLLLALGAQVNVECGYACNLPIDELWQTMQMDLSHLQDFIERSRNNRIFELGRKRPACKRSRTALGVSSCHESDFIVSSDRELLEYVAMTWNRRVSLS